MKFPDIKYLFEPKSIAVVGASHNESKIGYKILNNIKSSGFEGRIYPVNPQGGIILGIDVKKGISEIPENIDIAVISIPAKFVFDAVKDACSKKVKFLIIITSGFSEIGNIEEEKKIVDYARNHGARVLGPNIFGIYSGASPINATFGSEDISKGNVAIVTQSGALGIAMMGKTRSAHIGLSAMISVGNKSDVDESDLLDYLVQDKNTKVIMMYIEGIKHGEKLVAALKNATKKKPVIAIKSGRSKRGAMAAASHTGSLAGADSIFSDIMMQCGVMRAESIEEAFGWCNFLSTAPHPKGENTVIITNGGGIGVMAADACEKYGVRLYDDLNKLNTLFSGAIPSFGSSKNPIDITGGADKNQYMQALKVAFKDKAVDSIICIGCETAIFKGSSLFEMISQIEENKMCRKPIIYSFIGGPEFDAAISSLKMKKIPMYGDVYEAISAIGVLYKNYRNKRIKIYDENISSTKYDIDIKAINKIIKKVRADRRNFLLSNEAQELMRAARIKHPQSFIAENIKKAVEFSDQIGYPVVLKVVSRAIIDKSDVGGVQLDLGDKEEVIDAYQHIIHSCKQHNHNARIAGIEVTEMLKRDGVETIIGARNDSVFGPIVMFGMGGIYVEVFKDVSFRSFPLSVIQAKGLIKETKTYPLLLGARGEKRKDIYGVLDTIMKLGIIINECREISDIEINPLYVYDQGDGVNAVDVRVLLSNPTRGGKNE